MNRETFIIVPRCRTRFAEDQERVRIPPGRGRKSDNYTFYKLSTTTFRSRTRPTGTRRLISSMKKRITNKNQRRIMKKNLGSEWRVRSLCRLHSLFEAFHSAMLNNDTRIVHFRYLTLFPNAKESCYLYTGSVEGSSIPYRGVFVANTNRLYANTETLQIYTGNYSRNIPLIRTFVSTI